MYKAQIIFLSEKFFTPKNWVHGPAFLSVPVPYSSLQASNLHQAAQTPLCWPLPQFPAVPFLHFNNQPLHHAFHFQEKC